VKLILPFIFSTILIKGYSQTLRYPAQLSYSRSVASSKEVADIFSCMVNQALLPAAVNFTAGIFGENRFLLKELHSILAAVAFKAGNGTAGVSAQYFGNPLYNESRAGLAYGKKLGKVNIGAQFNYHVFSIAGEGTSGLINMEAGTLWQLTDKVTAGLHIFNPSGGRFGYQKQEKLAGGFRTGFGFQASAQTFFSIDISKEEARSVKVSSLIIYNFADRFVASAGLNSTAQTFASGGWSWMDYKLEVSLMYQWPLGWSPGLTFIYQPQKQHL